MTAIAEQTGAWLADFTQLPAATPWVKELREAAFQRFAALGFQTTHDEEWRFTNVAPIARGKFQSVGGDYWVKRPSKVEVLSAEEARQHLAHYATFEQNAFVALNTAFLQEEKWVAIRIPAGAVIESPIEIKYIPPDSGFATAVHPRTLILAGADSHCTIVESYEGAGAYFTNAVTEIVAGDRAVVDHYKIQRESLEAFHVATLAAQLGRSANFVSHSISLGGALVRNDVNVVLSEGTEATINGLYIANGAQHIDNHTSIDHVKPHGTSHELYKGILDDQARAVFNGRIIVRQDAQKTDSKQTNKNLVLSDDALTRRRQGRTPEQRLGGRRRERQRSCPRRRTTSQSTGRRRQSSPLHRDRAHHRLPLRCRGGRTCTDPPHRKSIPAPASHIK